MGNSTSMPNADLQTRALQPAILNSILKASYETYLSHESNQKINESSLAVWYDFLKLSNISSKDLPFQVYRDTFHGIFNFHVDPKPLFEFAKSFGVSTINFTRILCENHLLLNEDFSTFGSNSLSLESLIDLEALEYTALYSWLKKENDENQFFVIEKNLGQPNLKEWRSLIAELNFLPYSKLNEASIKDLQKDCLILPTLLVPQHYQGASSSTLLNYTTQLQLRMPAESRHDWKLLFNSVVDGNSWNSFVSKIEGYSKLLVLISPRASTNGTHPPSVFGAYIHDPLIKSADWKGNAKNFLFSFRKPYPSINENSFSQEKTISNSSEVALDASASVELVFNSSGLNSHYQYFNYQTMTMPNGLGLGGQLDYFGLWIDSDFIHGHSFPSATYSNSNLSDPVISSEKSPGVTSTNDFILKSVIVISCSSDRDAAANKTSEKSAVSNNPDVVTILEMANKTVYSKDYAENNS
ncbi:TLD domain-containing protein 1 [Smittium mucronatum]|uniref:MTOR-associated protein MEAK7 n=1 Tax=Smittium mucronatum TaxID=133383 RepID=A0A1R0GRM2_9FUNG|nr:TLD domain-containing protein 1 [Smittium mucronatum]